MKARGFTLIELLAAMAILAVVSVMAVQALSGVFFQRSVLGDADARSAQLIRTLSTLRQDLEAAVPLPVPPERGDTGGIGFDRGVLTLARGGLPVLPGNEGADLGLVRWQIEGDTLSRSLTREGAEEAPDLPMLPGVSDLTVEAIDPPDEGLAPGWEVILQTEAFGAIRLVVAR